MILTNDPSLNFTELGAERLLVHEVEEFADRKPRGWAVINKMGKGF